MWKVGQFEEDIRKVQIHHGETRTPAMFDCSNYFEQEFWQGPWLNTEQTNQQQIEGSVKIWPEGVQLK